MRMKIVLSSIVAVVLAVAGAAYVAVIGVEIEASRANMVGTWTSGGRTTLTFRADGTFTADGVSACIGPVGVFVDGDSRPTVLTVDSGVGTWNVTPDTNNPGVDTFLAMTFRSPQNFTLHWQAYNIRWQFRPMTVILGSNDTGGITDATAVKCALEARNAVRL